MRICLWRVVEKRIASRSFAAIGARLGAGAKPLTAAYKIRFGYRETQLTQEEAVSVTSLSNFSIKPLKMVTPSKRIDQCRTVRRLFHRGR